MLVSTLPIFINFQNLYYCSSFIYCKHERDVSASRRKCFLAIVTFIYWLFCIAKKNKSGFTKKRDSSQSLLYFFIESTKRSTHSKPLPIPANIHGQLNQISRELQRYNHRQVRFHRHLFLRLGC